MTYRLLTYTATGNDHGGILVGERIFALSDVLGTRPDTSVLDVLKDFGANSPRLTAFAEQAAASSLASVPLDQVQLTAPLKFPPTLYCAGGNYNDHGGEMTTRLGIEAAPTLKERKEEPWFFLKNPVTSIVGPGSAVSSPGDDVRLDWELELCAVVGKPARNVSADEALSYICGYTVANDLSFRGLMRRTNIGKLEPFYYDWFAQKCFDGSCPIGPWIVPAEEIGDPQNLAMKLWVDEELKQDSNTSRMIYTVAELIAALSKYNTLMPGDLVLTGTPSGVGMGTGEFLKPGQTVRLWIEKIGEFRHSIG